MWIRSRSPAVIRDADDDASALVGGAEADGALRRLALGCSLGGRFNAVIHRVANHVDKGVAQFFNDVAIQLRLLAFEYKVHLLLLLGGEIAYQPGHLMKRTADGHHAQGHGVALQIGGDAAELAQVARQLEAVDVLHVGILHHHGLRNHQFPHQVHETV